MKILNSLLRNGRESAAKIGRELGLSGPAVHARIKNLESENVITGYRAVLDAEKLNASVIAFVEIYTRPFSDPGDLATFESFFIDHPAVIECHDCTGTRNYLAKVQVDDLMTLREVLKLIRHLPCVTDTETSISMMQIKQGASLPLIYLEAV